VKISITFDFGVNIMYDYHVSLFYDLSTNKYESIEFYCPDAIIKRLLVDVSSFSNYCLENYLSPIAYSEIIPIGGVEKKRIVFIKKFDISSIPSFYKYIFEFIQSLPNRSDDEKKPILELVQLGAILGNTKSVYLIEKLFAYYEETNHE
jgi:hypothetical protein